MNMGYECRSRTDIGAVPLGATIMMLLMVFSLTSGTLLFQSADAICRPRGPGQIVTVDVLGGRQIDNPDWPDNGDYYVQVTIGNSGLPHINRDDYITGRVFPTPETGWTFVEGIPYYQISGDGQIPITITLWDRDDGGTRGQDDLMDITPEQGLPDAHFMFNHVTQSATIPRQEPPGDAVFRLTGNGESDLPHNEGGERARIIFDVFSEHVARVPCLDTP
jgi:hypothetical protein